jgi:hypothetical protein
MLDLFPRKSRPDSELDLDFGPPIPFWNLQTFQSAAKSLSTKVIRILPAV